MRAVLIDMTERQCEDGLCQSNCSPLNQKKKRLKG